MKLAEIWRPVRRPAAAVLVICAITAAGMIVAIMTFQNRSNTSWSEANQLNTVNAEINKLSSLEWQAIAAGQLSPELAESLAATRTAVAAEIANITGNGGEAGLTPVYATYDEALTRELAAIEAGDIAGAEQIGGSQVNAAFEQFQRTVEDEAGEHTEKAEATGSLVKTITALIIIGALMAIWLVITLHEGSIRSLNSTLEKKVKDRTGELQSANAKLEQLYQEAHKRLGTDSLTGLFNHSHLQEKAREMVAVASASGGRFALIVIDVDGFKAINDSLGHQHGDEVLRGITEVLRRCEPGALLFRQGGDEFAVLLPDADVERAQSAAESIRAAIQGGSFGTPVTASLGIAAFPGIACSAEELMYGADIAMYWGKSSGRNRVVVWEEMLRRRAEDVLPGHTVDARVTTSRDVVAALMAALAAKDPAIKDHSQRCSAYSLKIAAAMGLNEAQSSVIRLASLLHDIGMIHIRDEILHKPGPLTPAEWEQLREHPAMAVQILGNTRSLAGASPAILHHHERFDGAGYPDGLAGQEIPLASRIILVADAYDAMISDRPHQKAMSMDTAIDELLSCAGTQFDPLVVEAFVSILRETGEDGGATDDDDRPRQRRPVSPTAA